MKEGFWLNCETRHFTEIKCRGVDHEMCIRSPSTHKWLGVPAAVAAEFGRFKPQTDRDAFLKHVMETLPLCRIRGHVTHISIEFWADDPAERFPAIGKWAKRFAAPTMPLHLVNLATGENWQVVAGEWDAFAKRRVP